MIIAILAAVAIVAITLIAGIVRIKLALENLYEEK